MGRLKLEKELELTKEEAKKLFDTYHNKVPFVRTLSQGLIEFCKDEKLLFTLYDRFCRFNKWETTNKKWNPKINRFEEVKLYKEQEAREKYIADQIEAYGKDNLEENFMDHFEKHYQPAFTYKALNRLIQGSAADMTKKAMVDLYEQGIVPHLQIHDELCLSIKNKEQADLIKNTMEKTIILKINNKVNYKKGTNWGNIKS